MAEPLSKRIAVGMKLKRSDGQVVTLTQRVPENGVPGWDYVVDDGADGWFADEYLDDFEGHYTILGSLFGVECGTDSLGSIPPLKSPAALVQELLEVRAKLDGLMKQQGEVFVGVCPPDAKQEFIDLDRRHNAHCPRCYGPAYQGLGALRCERAGGCLVEREPKVGISWTDRSGDLCFGERRHGAPGERFWFLCDKQDKHYATRDLAVAAWREAAIARAKREAGL